MPTASGWSATHPPATGGRLAFQDAVRRVVVEKYADFTGRASLAEYWWFALAYLLAFFTAFFAVGLVAATVPPLAGLLGFALLAAFLALLIPSFAVTVRRLHDTGRSGAWWLISFIPFGGIVLLVFTLLRGDPWPNRYGAPPLDG